MDRLERLLPKVSYFYTSMIIMGPHEGHNLEKRLRRYKRNFDRLGIAREVRKLIGIPTQVGAGDTGDIVDFCPLSDTNHDGQTDDRDSCVPVGGLLSALRSVRLVMPPIEAARRSEVNFVEKTPEETLLNCSEREIFPEDFSSSCSGWSCGGDQDYQVGYAIGACSIRVKSKNIPIWTIYEIQFTDDEISVEAREMDSVGNGEYGLIRRCQDTDNFYSLLISEDVYFSIQTFENKEQQFLFDWEHLTRLDPAGTNRITAICVGNKLQLPVNDYIPTTAYDDSFQSSSIGLIAGTFSTPGLRVTFDNLVVNGS